MVGGVEELRSHQPLRDGIFQSHPMLILDVRCHDVLGTCLAAPQVAKIAILQPVAGSISVPDNASIGHEDQSIAVVSVVVVLELVVGSRHDSES